MTCGPMAAKMLRDTARAMSRENVEVVRQARDAWLRGDLTALFAVYDEEVVWDTSHFRDWPESAYHGVEGVGRFLTEWLEVWDRYELVVDEIIAAPDGRVVSMITQRGVDRDSGLPMHMEMAMVTTVRNDKVTRIDNYDDRGDALEAAVAGAAIRAEPLNASDEVARVIAAKTGFPEMGAAGFEPATSRV